MVLFLLKTELTSYSKALNVGFKVLVTKPDFYNEETRRHLASTVSELISLNIVPIINTNDAVSPPPMADEDLAGVSICLVQYFSFKKKVFYQVLAHTAACFTPKLY